MAVVKPNSKYFFALFVISSIVAFFQIIIFLYLFSQMFKDGENEDLDWKNKRFNKMYRIICIIALVVNAFLLGLTIFLIYKFHKKNYSEILQHVSL